MEITKEIFEKYRISGGDGLYLRYGEYLRWLQALDDEFYSVEQIGASEDGRNIYSITAGKGKIKVFLWSQMHGDEPTGTKSIFDVLNYLYVKRKTAEVKRFWELCTLYIIPMLNPDGAERFTRENARGLDINRDAGKWQTAEARVWKSYVEKIQPDYAFNLHDQSAYYSVSGTSNRATLSFLAPAFNSGKDINPVRGRAMRLIAGIYRDLQEVLPGGIGRYNDDFCSDCFGDYLQAYGASTLLFESGFYPGDREKKKTRFFHFYALLSAFERLSQRRFEVLEVYNEIPRNIKNYYDLLVSNVMENNNVLVYLAIRFSPVLRKGKLENVIDEVRVVSTEELSRILYEQMRNAKGKTRNEILKSVLISEY